MADVSFDTLLDAALDRVLARRLAPILALLEELVSREIDAWVGVEEAARALGLEPVTVRRSAARGDLAAKKIGKTWRIARSSLRAPTAADVAVMASEARQLNGAHRSVSTAGRSTAGDAALLRPKVTRGACR
jgi:excisionase family DNA binding protein